METFELFSDKCINCLGIKRQVGPYSSTAGDKWATELPRAGDTYELVKEWGLSPSDPISIRFTTGGQSLEEMDQPLDGAKVDLSAEGKVLHVAVASLLPWRSPCVLIKKLTFDSKYKGSVVIFPTVTCVDVYLTIDGNPQQDGLMFKEDASLTDPAIAQGVPEGAFCTLVSPQFSDRDEHALHLPCVATKSELCALLNADQAYGAEFASAFIAAAARAGEGEHKYDIRIAPRGYVEDDEDGSVNTFGIANADNYKKYDDDAREFVQNEVVGRVFSSASNPKLCASFTMTVSSEILAKAAAAAEKPAPEAITGCSEQKELCDLASEFATGAPAATASKTLGLEVSGQPAHVFLARSNDYGNDVGNSKFFDPTNKVKPKEACQFVYVYALWKAPGAEDDDEGMGVMTRFMMEKWELRNYNKVSEPKWQLSRTYAAERIKNRQITAAQERDS